MAGKVVRKLTSTGNGQSLVDRVTSIKHSISGSIIAKTICKATTEELSAPKRKHIIVLTNLTYQPRLSMTEFANYIILRSHNTSSVVSFKALITIHHLMNSGSESFSQYIASNNCQLSASRSIDKSGCYAFSMFSFIRHYANYLDSRASSYLSVAFDFCKAKKRPEETNLRTMPRSKLFKVLPPLERQIDALLAFDASSNELLNPVILAAYFLLYKDLIRLYAVYNEAMINIIEHFFTMNKKDCQESLKFYKSFIARMDHVNSFVKVAEACEKLELHDGLQNQSLIFKPVPSSVLEALEQHLAFLEGNKPSDRAKDSLSTSASSISQPAIEEIGEPVSSSMSLEHYLIIEEERLRLESFVSQAQERQKNQQFSADLIDVKSTIRSNSDGDLLDLFDSVEATPSASVSSSGAGLQNKQGLNFGDADDLPDQGLKFPKNHIPSSSSQFALYASGSASAVDDIFRPVSNPQFPPQPNNAFFPPTSNLRSNLLPTNPFAEDLFSSSSNPGLSFPAPNPTVSVSGYPTTATLHSSTTNPSSDLDSRLSELAGQLSMTAVPVTSVNWTTGRRPLATAMPGCMAIQSRPLLPPTPASTNPWPTNSALISTPYRLESPTSSAFPATFSSSAAPFCNSLSSNLQPAGSVSLPNRNPFL